MMLRNLFFVNILLLCGVCCVNSAGAKAGEIVANTGREVKTQDVMVGATDTAAYLPLLRGRRVALLANHTAVVGDEHLVDMLHSLGYNITAIFSPEHGFRGDADAGEVVRSSVDEKTGIAIRSLYDGNTKRPSNDAMNSFDVLLVDMQDVGVRFYTYYIAMLRMMDACADFGREVIVLDRPNPHGDEVDGPILDMVNHKSGVGALPIPVLHGLTMGEIALMSVGEGWSKPCKLTVVKCRNYDHSVPYQLPIAPSPNLRSDISVELYPSLCLFEGTQLSVGRGTDRPFECFGHPDLKGIEGYDYSFVPRPNFGAKEPLFDGVQCYGVDMSQSGWVSKGLSLEWLIEAYKAMPRGDRFFKPVFEKLIGVSYVRRMIIEGYSEEQIRARWQDEVEEYKLLREKYIIYGL